MAIPEFTLTAGPEGFSRVMGGVTMTAESLEGLEVTFTPNIMGGQFLQVDGGLRHIDSVTVTLDADGKINGDTGIKLLANDPSLDLEKPIQWTIAFDKDFRFDGFKRQFSKWSFIAPDDGETKGLHELSHVTGLSATNVTRGLRGYRTRAVPVDPEDPQTLFQWEDETGTPVGGPVELTPTGVTALSVDDEPVTYYNLDTTPPTASDVGAYTADEVDDLIAGMVTVTGSQSLSNKTLVNPVIQVIKGASGNNAIITVDTANAVNYVTVLNSATGNAVQIGAGGDDTNVDLWLVPKANARVVIRAAAGVTPRIAVSSPDANAGLNIQTQGTGVLQVNGGEVPTLNGTKTFTSKTINLGNNTITGTLAQFNTACSDADFVSLAGTETVSNKTLTSPKVTSGNAPATATSTGTVGQIEWDANYVYVCTATNTWKRAALTAW